MARQQFGPLMSARAGADLSTTGQYLLVKIGATSGPSSNGLSYDNEPVVILSGTAGEDVLGVLLDKPKDKEAATVQTYDTTKIKIGGSSATVTVGDKVQSAGDGTIITAATAGHFVLGVALETGTTGSIIAVRLNGGHYPIPA